MDRVTRTPPRGVNLYVGDLRLAGYPIQKHRCSRHSHKSLVYEYALGDG